MAESINVLTGERRPLAVRPSRAADFEHGFASFAKFFPEGKALTAQIEEAFWDRLHGRGRSGATHVFDDQYLSTGGQLYEILMGHDRLLGDLRPLVLSSLGYKAALTCHPVRHLHGPAAHRSRRRAGSPRRPSARRPARHDVARRLDGLRQ